MNITLELMLQLAIVTPLLSTFAIVVTGKSANLRESVTIASCLILIFLVVNLYQGVLAGESISVFWWELLPGLSISFDIEPLGMLFALIASFLWLVTTIYAIGYMRSHHEKNQTRFYVCFALAIGAVMGLAFSANLFTLFIFYEVLTLSTYPLVTHAGTEKAKKGGRTYLGILLTTSIVFFLLAIVSTWFVAGTLDFKLGGIFADDVDKGVAGILLVLFIFGIGKAAIMPFHRWLPAAMVAPTPVSSLLHAVAVVKAGVFTVLKVCVFIFGLDLLAVLPTTQFLLYLAGASVLLASIIAMKQDNLKARLAYSTVSQLGYVTIGALLATSSGVIGSSMHIAMHAFGKITLFFCAGAILVTLHKSKISEMRGIGRQMPLTMIAFFIASLSIIGVPPAGGTWSKWYLMMGTIETEQFVLMVILMLSSLLNIAYLLPIPFHAFFPNLMSFKESMNVTNKSETSENKLSGFEIKEAPLPSLIAIVVTTIGCLMLFIYPQPLFELASAVLTGRE
ncbi:monovalent cation/H+ antiporter subunit D family protein [Colwellia sp. M166]|uniref:monovalent cation/H+ antiporter subunit D family protein n=1 Tax=Colwellia sp. M166 TaxID=2583805 RepID=UPI00211E7FD3|nr:monovalent cation/H+ antiporter subunit D family protein [Colwellia sp. M166]UUO25164.1 monovalent cation/H+ antiporter subunit D family protein [Colwellia sp. M166]|tara:strand:+ start:12877 stop:14400 length:1524 start_codon:yes stop_codon:yes gene_type:complete